MSTATASAQSSSGGGQSALLLLLKLRTFIALIIVVVFFALMAPNFVSVANAVIVSKHVAINAILAIGMTYVILTGGIDLSVGSIVGLTGMVAGGLLVHGLQLPMLGLVIYPNVIEVVLIALGVGTAIGAINGFLITILGIPVSIVMLIVLALIAAYVAQRTPFGRRVYAVGGNERAAALSGVRVDRIKIAVYMISGFCAAVVGLIVSSQLVASHPASGETFELNAIAAAVLGGTSLSGGRGLIGGTIVGAFVIGVLSDGLVMMGVSEFWQMVIKGLVIIAAVVLDQLQRRLAANSRQG